MGIIQTGVLSFYAIKGSVEIGCLNSNFRYEVAVDVGGECGRIALSWARKECSVNKSRYRGFMHFFRSSRIRPALDNGGEVMVKFDLEIVPSNERMLIYSTWFVYNV